VYDAVPSGYTVPDGVAAEKFALFKGIFCVIAAVKIHRFLVTLK